MLSVRWSTTSTRLTADWTTSRGAATGAATALATSNQAANALPMLTLLSGEPHR